MDVTEKDQELAEKIITPKDVSAAFDVLALAGADMQTITTEAGNTYRVAMLMTAEAPTIKGDS